MRRPLFLFFIGLVLGEAAAIFLNRIGFFVMALFLLIFMVLLEKSEGNRAFSSYMKCCAGSFFLWEVLRFLEPAILMRLTGYFLKKH